MENSKPHLHLIPSKYSRTKTIDKYDTNNPHDIQFSPVEPFNGDVLLKYNDSIAIYNLRSQSSIVLNLSDCTAACFSVSIKV